MNSGKESWDVFTVVEADGKDDYWLKVGKMYRHASADGFNIYLNALPLNGKLVIKPPRKRADKTDK